MTEDEAKTKWCPFSRASGFNGANRFVHDTGSPAGELAELTPCIASACMAWRWSEAKRTAAFLEAVQQHMQGSAKPNFNAALQAVYAESGGKFERTEGSCGLAGASS